MVPKRQAQLRKIAEDNFESWKGDVVNRWDRQDAFSSVQDQLLKEASKIKNPDLKAYVSESLRYPSKENLATLKAEVKNYPEVGGGTSKKEVNDWIKQLEEIYKEYKVK